MINSSSLYLKKGIVNTYIRELINSLNKIDNDAEFLTTLYSSIFSQSNIFFKKNRNNY